MAFVRVEVKNKMQFVKIDDLGEVTCLNLAIKGKNKKSSVKILSL